MPPHHPAGQGPVTTAFRARKGASGASRHPQRTWPQALGRKTFPLGAAPRALAATVLHALLCLGAMAVSKLCSRAPGCQGSAAEASGLCCADVYAVTGLASRRTRCKMPCLAQGRIWNGRGRPVGRAPGPRAGRRSGRPGHLRSGAGAPSSVRSLRHAFLGLFKGSGTFFPMHLSGNGWQVGSAGAGSECLPLPLSLLPPGFLGDLCNLSQLLKMNSKKRKEKQPPSWPLEGRRAAPWRG